MAKEATVTVPPSRMCVSLSTTYQASSLCIKARGRCKRFRTMAPCFRSAASPRCFPLPGCPLIVNSSIQFRHNLERLTSCASGAGQLKAANFLRTSKNMHIPLRSGRSGRHGDDPYHTPNHTT